MPPKFDPNAQQFVYVRAYGAEVPSAAVLAPKVGPLGMSPKKVGDEIAKGSKDWKGIKVTVKLTIQNRAAKAEVVPNATSLLIKQLKEPIRDRKKVKNITHSGNLTKEQFLGVVKEMRANNKSQAKTAAGTAKECLGTANAVGCTVDGCDPRDLQEQIDEGEWEVPDC